MLSVIQRVTKGKVIINDKLHAEISSGYVIFLGIFKDDTAEDVIKLVEKISNLRIMSDENRKMNRSILETKGAILLVSQFTLCGDVSYGRRPSFIKAMEPEKAKLLYLQFINKLEEKGIPVKTGEFGSYMQIEIVNDGPVTVILDSKKL